jgi:hypothetical protein
MHEANAVKDGLHELHFHLQPPIDHFLPAVVMTEIPVEEDLGKLLGDLNRAPHVLRDRGVPVHVFHAVAGDEGMAGRTEGKFVFDASVRLSDVRAGRRNRGLSVMELVVVGPSGPDEVEAAVAQWLESRIKPHTPRSSQVAAAP